MGKTEQEINAEKLGKPRPDLLPARALTQGARGLSHFHRQPFSTEDTGNASCALYFLRVFREVLGETNLRAALVHTSNALGGWHQACMAGGRVMGYGFRKHGDCTWRVAGTEQADPQTHIASAERHLLEYLIDPEAREEGSGLPVLEHAFSQLCITLDLVLDPPQLANMNDGHGTVTARLRGEVPPTADVGNGKGCP